LVGAEYYTFISQLETGRGRVPPDRYRVWASALQVDPKLFVKQLLSYYDPITYGILFGDQEGDALVADDGYLADPLDVDDVPHRG
jgi:hypothetical protein